MQPGDLEQALAFLAEVDEQGKRCLPIAGGTDIYPGLEPADRAVPWLDLGAIDELRGIDEQTLDGQSWWRIGAATCWSDIEAFAKRGDWRALALAAAEVGGRQIQNRGTIGGNLCHASPAADGVPPLLALDALVCLRSATGRRRLPLAQFILGPRRTARRADELVESVLIKRSSGRRDSAFLKLGQRRYLVISAVMVAACIDWDENDRVAQIAVAVGACGPRAIRIPWFETAYLGHHVSDLAALITAEVPATALAVLSPIDDIRATAAYRLHAASALISRVMDDLVGRQLARSRS